REQSGGMIRIWSSVAEILPPGRTASESQIGKSFLCQFGPFSCSLSPESLVPHLGRLNLHVPLCPSSGFISCSISPVFVQLFILLYMLNLYLTSASPTPSRWKNLSQSVRSISGK